MPPSLSPRPISCIYIGLNVMRRTTVKDTVDIWMVYSHTKIIPMRTLNVDSGLVNVDKIKSLTDGCVPLVNTSTNNWNWGRFGDLIGCVNSCFKWRQKSKYSCAQVSCCWQKISARPVLILSLRSLSINYQFECSLEWIKCCHIKNNIWLVRRYSHHMWILNSKSLANFWPNSIRSSCTQYHYLYVVRNETSYFSQVWKLCTEVMTPAQHEIWVNT